MQARRITRAHWKEV